MLATNEGDAATRIPREQTDAAKGDGPPLADAGPHHRHRGIDGWRAIAAGFVVISHAVNYRFVATPGLAMHLAQRVSGPLALIGVQLFFVISGFIITSLMLREQATHGRVSIPAFYARRLCRIMPPLLAYYGAVLALAAAGALTIPASSLAASATFTCNIGFVDCDWWVAHTWSLAVEEQYYLGWPLLFGLLAPLSRRWLLIAVLAGGAIGIARDPGVFHSNFTSFGCIAAGSLYALSPAFRHAVQRATSTPVWLLAVALLVFGPLLHLAVPVTILLPVLVTYIIFAGNALRWVRAILETRVLQIVGAGSYSLYLWQQLFLAPAARYAIAPFPLVLLPPVVLLSVLLVERPFIRLGRRLSRRIGTAPA